MATDVIEAIVDSDNDYNLTLCVICHTSLSSDASAEHVSLNYKGIDTLTECSKIRGDLGLTQYLVQKPAAVNVHVHCRKSYTHKRNLHVPGQGGVSAKRTKLRSEVCHKFNWKEDCFFCCKPIDTKHKSKHASRSVSTLEFYQHILDMCSFRLDTWSIVHGRLQAMHSDLVSEEAVYHTGCRFRFVTGQNTPTEANNSVCSGRPEHTGMMHVFLLMCEWLESKTDFELHTLDELRQHMIEIAGSEDNVYSSKTLKRKLQGHYGDHIFHRSRQP